MNEEGYTELSIRCSEYSFLLGQVMGSLIMLEDDPRVAECQRKPIRDLVIFLSARLDKLYY
jgi:hypothetical protein